jgi:uncharacterized membrane protein
MLFLDRAYLFKGAHPPATARAGTGSERCGPRGRVLSARRGMLAAGLTARGQSASGPGPRLRARYANSLGTGSWFEFPIRGSIVGSHPDEDGDQMTTQNRSSKTCAICGKSFPSRNVVSGEIVRKEIAEEIRKLFPAWSAEHFICREDLTDVRGKYVHALLASERGELSTLEQEVVRSLREHEILASNVDAEFEQNWSFGERLADKIAAFGGSWTFLISFGVFLAIWIAMNSAALLWRPLDPYPFIFLNLILSCIAAIQAPVIMMSQNRQEEKDRVRSQHDYQVNLKAELEIRHLHEKVDHLLSHQWERLVQIQELQLELLADLDARK